MPVLQFQTIGDLGLPLRISRLGVRDELMAPATRPQQLADQGLDVDGIAKRVRQLLGLDGGTILFK